MAASRIKGITIEIGGDTTKLQTALKGVNTEIKNTQQQLKDVEKLLKLDPGNTELLAQKHKLLGEAVQETKEKLETLKTAAEQANTALANGDISQEQYDALQREIVETENELKNLESQANQSATALQKISATGEKLQTVGDTISGVGTKLLPVTGAVVAAGTASVKTAADFESAMSKVSAVSGATGSDLDALSAKAREMGTFGGSANSNKVAVLEEGMKYTPISISPNEAQFLDTRKFQIDEIARIFRVPPHMVGDLDKSSFSNIEQQSLEFVKYTLDPWVSRWEQAMSRALLTPEEKKHYFFKFNVDGLLRGDYQSRMNGYATARQNGWMSANDIRELENLDRIPEEAGGDLYLINGNMTKLQDAGIFANSASVQSGDNSAGNSGSDEGNTGQQESGLASPGSGQPPDPGGGEQNRKYGGRR